jgi:hypothetical protein
MNIIEYLEIRMKACKITQKCFIPESSMSKYAVAKYCELDILKKKIEKGEVKLNGPM